MYYYTTTNVLLLLLQYVLLFDSMDQNWQTTSQLLLYTITVMPENFSFNASSPRKLMSLIISVPENENLAKSQKP